MLDIKVSYFQYPYLLVIQYEFMLNYYVSGTVNTEVNQSPHCPRVHIQSDNPIRKGVLNILVFSHNLPIIYYDSVQVHVF